MTTMPERASPSARFTTRSSLRPAGFTPRNSSTAAWRPSPAGRYTSARPSPNDCGNSTSCRVGPLVNHASGLTGTTGSTWKMKPPVLAAVRPWGVTTASTSVNATSTANAIAARAASLRHLRPGGCAAFDATAIPSTRYRRNASGFIDAL